MEMLISVGISGVMFVIIISAWVGSAKSLAISDDYSYESNGELYAMDYIVRDLRRATTVTIPSAGNSLTVTMPDCYSTYDSQGNPTSAPVTPTIVNGAPKYGTLPLTVSYSINGNRLLRTQTIGATGVVSTLVVCSKVNGFALAFVPLSTTVTFSITFDPKYQGTGMGLRSGTKLAGTVAVRAIRFQ